jgi:hypothetical protein
MLDNYSYKKLFHNKANVPADLQLSCKREQKQISFGYAERSRQSIRLICRN